ncbi:MAG TPA: hypothetical protein VK960_03000 [Acidimicrobiia bacterium]|nr:hypothetical protein [Acidimicrobiia bacterium]
MDGVDDTRGPQAEAHEDYNQAWARLQDARDRGTPDEIAAAERDLASARDRWHELVKLDRASQDRRQHDR